MKRRDFMTTAPLLAAGLLVSLNSLATTPEELPFTPPAIDPPSPPQPKLTLVYYSFPFAHPHFIAAQYEQYRAALGLTPLNPFKTIYMPHHRPMAQSPWELTRKDPSWNHVVLTFAGHPNKDKPSFALFPNEWLRMADNAFVIDQDGVRVVKARNDTFRDISYA